tara:strand:- start:1271 stop:2026 length:756 start_codon:yes stop_codon:yes gene_type:complete
VENDLPIDHPRYESLKHRHLIIDGMKKNIVANAGLIAHGRGETFDYLLGEKTHDFSIDACRAAAAYLYLAKNPIFSINGNVTMLSGKDIVELCNERKIPLEINIFYRSKKRIEAIKSYLKKFNPFVIFGYEESHLVEIENLNSDRRIVDKRGIAVADVVFVPLEDGDRAEILKENGKKIITVDLNPLSRTAKMSDVTIIDNIVRVVPLISEFMSGMNDKEADEIIHKYNNNEIIQKALNEISEGFINKFNH